MYVRKIFRKTNISYSLIRCQGERNVSFSENFAYVSTIIVNTTTLIFECPRLEELNLLPLLCYVELQHLYFVRKYTKPEKSLVCLLFMFITSWTIMFNEATFREMLLPSLGNDNDYVAHIYRKYADPDGNINARWEFVDAPSKPDILAIIADKTIVIQTTDKGSSVVL